jgi:HPt (histidine-containing phosphotransfer) domain-containing protein
LKGGAASVGATKLCQLATRLDKASHETLRLKAAQFTEELDATVAQAIQALDSFLASRQADQNARPKR